MDKNRNIKETSIGQTVTIGRMKGNINLGDNIYKMSSKTLSTLAQNSINGEHRKISLNCIVTIKHNEPLKITVTPTTETANNLDIYSNLNITYNSEIIPENAQNRPLEKEKIIAQINKTNDSIFEFSNIDVELDPNIFLPKFSATLNDLRRKVLESVYDYAISNIKRTCIKKVEPDSLNN